MDKVKDLLSNFDLENDGMARTRSSAAKKVKLEKMTNELKYQLLYEAVRSNSTEVLEVLLSSGFNVKQIVYSKDEGPSALLLCTAIESSNMKMLEILLDSGASINDRQHYKKLLPYKTLEPKGGLSALHCAVERSEIDFVRFLLERGAATQVMNYSGQSVLHLLTTKECDMKIAELLLDHGASIEAEDLINFTPLDYCTLNGYHGLYSLVLGRIRVETIETTVRKAFHMAVEFGRVKTVQLILDHVSDVKSWLNDFVDIAVKKTPSIEIIETFVERGADVFGVDEDGRTTLHKAACKENEPVIFSLTTCGIDVNKVDESGKTALHIAALGTNPVIIEILLQRKADIDSCDGEGRTALGLAIQNRNTDVCKSFVKWLAMRHYGDNENANKGYLEDLKKIPALIDYWKDCKNEMTLLCGDQIQGTSLRPSGILTGKYAERLGAYTMKDLIVWKDISKILEQKYPIYFSLMLFQYHSGCLRYFLLKHCRKILPSLFKCMNEKLPPLPITCINLVLGYLTDCDLTNLTRVWDKVFYQHWPEW